MADLSEKGRKLIDVAMANDEPPPTDDSWGTLVSRLTGEASRGTLPVRERPARASIRSWIWITLAVATVLAIVVVSASSREPLGPGVVVADRPAPPARAQPAKVQPGKVQPAKPQPAKPQPVEQLLVEAEAALTGGDPDRAMVLLQRHAELAATDARAPQRMALRVLVLCAQGKREQARDEAKAFLVTHGQSQWGDSVRRSCAADEPQ